MEKPVIRSIMRPTAWGNTPILLPLRLFLASAFIVAGLDKITDPTFFDLTSNASIGAQLQGFAQNSPLAPILTTLVIPNAAFFGWFIALGEIAIGLGTLLGLLSRIAAFFGLLLSFTFYLTSSWTTHPFYFGPDLPYTFGWLTLLLAGPHPAFSLDGMISRANARYAATHTERATRTGAGSAKAQPVAAAEPDLPPMKRKDFIAIAAATTFTVFTAAFVTARDIQARSEKSTTTPADSMQVSSQTATNEASSATITSGNKVPVLALDSLAPGKATIFTIPGSRNQGILVRYTNGSIAAFSAVCTHAYCIVGYDATTSQMQCPCHGSTFDDKTGAVLNGPARLPLTRLPIEIDPNGKTVLYTK